MFRPSVIVSTTRRPDSEASAVMAASSAFQIGVPPLGHSSLPMTCLSTALSPVRCGLIAISSPKRADLRPVVRQKRIDERECRRSQPQEPGKHAPAHVEHDDDGDRLNRRSRRA